MKMPILQKACCCWPLYVGTAVIGWLGVLFGLFEILLCIHLYIMGHVLDDTLYFLLLLFLSISHLILSGFLIKAVLMSQPEYVVPWLISGVVILLVLHGPIAYFLFVDILIMIQYCMALLFFDFIAVYLWLWVFSYYEKMNNIDIWANSVQYV